MLIYLGNEENDSTRASQETIKALSEKLASVLPPKSDKAHNKGLPLGM